MSKTLLIIIGLACAMVMAAGIMHRANSPVNTALKQLHDKNLKIRIKALHRLHDLGAKSSTPKIAKLLKDKEYIVRQETIFVLGKLSLQEVVPEIIKVLQDNDSEIRMWAAYMLAAMRAKESIPAIKKLLNDKDKWVRLNAEYALKDLGVPDEELRSSVPRGEENIEKAKASNITILRQFTDFDSGVRFRQYYIFYTQDEIDSFLVKKTQEGRPIPNIGFTGISKDEMCLGIFTGDQCNPCEFRTELKEEPDKIVFRYEFIGYQIITHEGESGLGTREATPFGYFIIPKTNKKIEIVDYPLMQK